MSISNSFLPDELWRRILEIGIKTSGFRYKDLCSISISCRRLHRLSNENSLWSHLLSSDFPSSSSSSSSSSTTKSSTKTLYRERFERDREKKLAVNRRIVLRKESQIVEHSRKIREIETRLADENHKLKTTVSELSHLRLLRCGANSSYSVVVTQFLGGNRFEGKCAQE
ncbi:F-box protein SKIP24 [Quercus suber]